MNRNIILMVMGLFGAVEGVWADPQITAVSGGTANGQSVTVSGSGFGLKPTAQPFIWESVEGGAFNPAWGAGNTNELEVNADNNRTPFSSYNAHMDFAGTNDDGFFRGPGNTVSERWFASYWFKLDPNWDWGTGGNPSPDQFLSNIKIFRVWNPSSSIDENLLVAYGGWANSLIYNMENVAGPSATGSYIGGVREAITLGTWHRFDFEYGENSAVGVSDGQFRMWFDGQLIADRNDLLTREDFDALKRIQVMGFDSVWGAGANGYKAPNDFYMDDVYQDTTWARIEIGDASTYSATRHRELQIATAWADGQATFQINQGSFEAGAPLWLYLTDANGTVNEIGFELTAVPEPSGQVLAILGFGVLAMGCMRRRSHNSEN